MNTSQYNWLRRVRGHAGNPVARLPGLGAWYTAGTTWCFQDIGATQPCGHLDPVFTWLDRSGRGRHQVQATAGKRPLLTLTAGRWEVVYDGVDDMTQAAFALANPTDVIAAFRYTVPWVVGNETVFDGAGADNLLRAFRSAANSVGSFSGSFGPALTVADTLARHIYRFLFNGASSLAQLDGGTPATGNPTSVAAVAGLTLGSTAFGGAPGPVGMSELVLCETALSDVDAARLRAYLRAAWGTP